MKNYRNRENSTSPGARRPPVKEMALLLFCLLMATALPALAAKLRPAVPTVPTEPLTGTGMIRLYRHDGGASDALCLSDALALSLAATNPADTPDQSLEAQAILLRSRAVWWQDYCALGEGNQGGHYLCDSPTHGLPYRSTDELIARLGRTEADARLQMAKQAVQNTDGQILCYEGEVVPALLHHSSSGMTCQVAELPWLTAVTTPEAGERIALSYSAAEAATRLAAAFDLLLPPSPTEWAMTLHPADADTAAQLEVAGVRISCRLAAIALDLPSADFSVEADAESVTFVCIGRGSGCGLSRSGAALYAKAGLDAEEIVRHYYPDCEILSDWGSDRS